MHADRPTRAVPAVMLIDVNMLGFASMFQGGAAAGDFASRPAAAIRGVPERLLALLDRFPGRVPVILWDDRCHWREAILPAYKRHRWQTDAALALLANYLGQCTVIREMLGHLGMLQISCPGQEADDLAGLLCRALPGDWEIVLATGDTDWYQALRENVEWHSPTTGKHVTHADLGDVARIREGPFLSTDHYVRSKALAGDASDGIPGVPGVGLRTAARLLRDHGSVEDLWRRSDSGEAFAGVVLRRVAGTEYRDLYRRNLRLVDWRLAPPLAAGCSVDRGGGDPDGFARLCGAYRMGALSRQADRLAECAAGTRHVIAAIERALRGSPPPLPA